MKKVLKVGTAGLMAVSMFGCSSSKEEDNTKVITIGISPDYAPYESLNKDGDIVGFDPYMVELFEEYLNEHSELWRTTENKSELSIVLYSCNTGRLKGLFLNIAQKIAKRLKVKVYAPSETLLPNPDCPGCFVVQRTWKKRGRTVTRKISKNLGFWTEFSKRTHKRIPRSAQAFKIDDMKIILQRSESSPK